ARRDDQDIVGPEGVGALRHVLEEIVGDETTAAGVATEESVSRLLDPGAPVAEIHVQDLVPVAVAVHEFLSPFYLGGRLAFGCGSPGNLGGRLAALLVASPAAAAPPAGCGSPGNLGGCLTALLVASPAAAAPP